MTLRRVTPWLLPCLLATAAAAPDGAALYRQKCADCHGAKGEGVEGKYREAMYGDWALPKLTRYIQRNMPEDDPETLTTAEAEAVSKYIYDAFYSREAQARINPARIELSRLTGKQYATVVADLLGRFAPADARPAPPVERGLSAVYFSVAQRGRFDNSKIIRVGADERVDFTFADGSADRARMADLPDFSAQWRGAVIVEETGDYEFVVRTPNSFRFWINRDFVPAEASLDVNVSRPDEPEHRVTVRLLGGRAYPIALDYWALPGKPGAPAPAVALRWKPPHGVERAIPSRHLTSARVRPTFVTQTRFPADDSSMGFERSGPVSKAWDEATTSGAFEVANFLGRHLDRLARTNPRDPERARKVAAWTETFVAAAFRRPLSAEEKLRYVGQWFAGEADPAAALKRAVLLALKAPAFLYTDLPAAEEAVGRPPDGATVAARLALGLWDGLPDAALERAARDGRLATAAGVRAEVERMLRDPRARAKLREFFEHWLQLRYVEDFAKDPALYPGFDDELTEDLRTSLYLFLDTVAWDGAADFRELLRSETFFANRRLAEFYGLPPPANDDFAPVRLADGRRAGVLTHPYVLAAFSYKGTTSPIHRGVFLTRSIAGRALKSPPVAVAFDDAGFTPGMSMREKVVKLTSQESCQGCHAVINPLGFSLEWFDAVGRFRATENGRPVDAVTDYITDEGQAVRLNSPRDVAEFALGNEQAGLRFVEQLFNHLVKQPAMAFGPDALPQLRHSFVASGFNLQKLLVEIVTLSARRGTASPLASVNPPPPRP